MEASLPRNVLLKEVPGAAPIIETLVKKGIFTIREEQVSRLQWGSAGSGSGRIRFSPAQKRALETIRAQFKEKDVVLLHGVTSSGKTEMYVQLIAEAIGNGKQALYLLPEIALTTQIINRLRKFFGDKIGIYHSRLNEQERAEVWKHTVERKYDIILGARSAVFLPFSDLGLVIVDEEHDYSFKQMDPAPRYHARDAALYLAHLHKASSILGSATPSLESYFLTRQGRYGLVELHERYGDLEMPSIRVVDIKDELRHGKMKTHFSSVLLKQLEEVLANAVAERRSLSRAGMLAGLLAGLVIAYLVPFARIPAPAAVTGWIAAAVFSIPVFFAGLLFASEFRVTASPSAATAE